MKRLFEEAQTKWNRLNTEVSADKVQSLQVGQPMLLLFAAAVCVEVKQHSEGLPL